MHNCKKCNKEIVRTSPKANNVKYCEPCRVEIGKAYRARRQIDRNNERASLPALGKIQCLICGRWYRKPMSHAWQKHGTNEAEYKRAFGLDHKKGLISDEHRELLREHTMANYDKVIADNLLKKGKRTRFIKGDTRAGRYERSAQTLQKLRERTNSTKRL